MNWIVVQLGAREHYAIPRVLHAAGRLKELVTDCWMQSDTFEWRQVLPGYRAKLSGRFCEQLADANICSFNAQAWRFEVTQRMAGTSGWPLMESRNAWFQRCVTNHLESRITANDVVFSYSYAARRIFQLAKRVGATTVLGQIDPGPVEEDLIANEVLRLPDVDTGFARASAEYWREWEWECELADTIVVNSEWSKQALVESGVSADKLVVIPLVYEPEDSAPHDYGREFPEVFSANRPLEILYLGQVIPRKGIQYVLEAAELLADSPVRFSVVGDPGPWQSYLEAAENIRVIGQVPRADVKISYQNADLFLFPTLSDGFGLTLLEARHWKLPVICTTRCGRAVMDGVDGVILDAEALSGQAIAEVIQKVLSNPSVLQRWSAAITDDHFDSESLRSSLLALEGAVSGCSDG